MLHFSRFTRQASSPLPKSALGGDSRDFKNVLIIGGSGFFGKLLCRSMVVAFKDKELKISVSGLNEPDTIETVKALRHYAGIKRSFVKVHPMDVDLNKRSEADLRKLLIQTKVSMVVNLAGPFFGAGHRDGGSGPRDCDGESLLPRHQRLVSACVRNSVHYVDIGESTQHINAVVSLAKGILEEESRSTSGEARRSTSIVVPGASTVPALSTAFAVDALRRMPSSELLTSPHPTSARTYEATRVTREKETTTPTRKPQKVSIEVVLSPGGRTTQSKLGFASIHSLFIRMGASFPVLRNGDIFQQSSWTSLRRLPCLAPVGQRLGCALELPDVSLMKADEKKMREKGELGACVVENYSMHAGLERPTVTRGLAVLGFLSSRLPHLAAGLRNRHFSTTVWGLASIGQRFLGTFNGSFYVRVARTDSLGGCCVAVVASKGDGVYLPIIPVLHVVEAVLLRGLTTTDKLEEEEIARVHSDDVQEPSTRRGENDALASSHADDTDGEALAGIATPCCSSVLVDPLTTSSSNRFAPTVEEMNRLIARIGLSIAFFRLHSVFAASMADDFCQLPPSIRAFHLLQSTRDANGVVSPIAISGTMVAEPVWNPLMVLAGFVMGLPRGVSVPTAFTMSIQADSTNEIWVRRFPGNFFHMRSTLWLKPSKAIKGFDVAESFFRGAVELQFRMKAVDPASLPFGADHPVKSSSSNHAVAGKVLHYNLIGAEVLGVPLPPFLCPVVEAVEYVTTEDGMESPGLRFDVMAKAPFGLGLLCHYRGSVTVQ